MDAQSADATRRRIPRLGVDLRLAGGDREEGRPGTTTIVVPTPPRKEVPDKPLIGGRASGGRTLRWPLHHPVRKRPMLLHDSREPAFFVVLAGRLEIIRPSAPADLVVATAGVGQFTGEMSMLSGRRGLVRILAAESGEVIEVARRELMGLAQGDADGSTAVALVHQVLKE